MRPANVGGRVIVLAAAMVVSAAVALWFSRDTTFSVDELDWFSTSPHFDADQALQPYLGHLVLTSRLIYVAILNLFGAGYLPFRLIAIGAVLLTAGLLFVFAKRRVGSVVALAPTLVLLFYGSDALHSLSGNGFTVLLALSAGLGGLLALERGDRAGDAGACLLLTLAVATYSVGLAFLVGAAVFILIGPDRERRAWVFLIPALLYAAWVLWSRHAETSTETNVALSNLLLTPDWALNSLAGVGAALLGLDYVFGASGSALGTPWGAVVAVVALVALGWRLWQGNITRWLWAVMAVPAALWAIHAATAMPEVGSRVPQNPRYIFAATIAVLLVAVEAARGVRLGRTGTLVVYGAVAISLATNLVLLRDGSATLRESASRMRTNMTAVEITGGRIGPRFMGLLRAALRESGQQDVATGYVEAVREFGSPGFTLPELRAQSEPLREQADHLLADSLGIGLEPAPGRPTGCERVRTRPGEPTTFELPRGGAVLRSSGQPAEVSLRRFGTAFSVQVGELEPGVPAALAVPRDSAPDPWYASTAAGALTICTPAG